MEGRIIIVALFCLLMAAACHETHLDGSSQAAFDASIRAMNQEHSVTEAQDFGAKLVAAETKLGRDAVRQQMNGLSYAQAKSYLETNVGTPAKKE